MTTSPPKPRIGGSIKKAWLAYGRHFDQALLFMLWQLALRLAVLVPLIFLFMKGYKPWALMCIPLYILLVIPARRNAASAYRDLLHGGSLFSPVLGLGSQGYGKALSSGLKTGLWALIWAIPLLAVAILIALRYFASSGVDGYNDVVTIGSQLDALGGGDWILGVLYLLAGIAALLLLVVVGMAFHSGARHDWAHGGRRIRGMHGRWGVLVTWLTGLALFIPLALALLLIALDLAKPLMGVFGSLKSGEATQAVDSNLLTEAENQVSATVREAASSGGSWHLWAGIAAFAVLFVPVVPLKGLLSAAWVDSLWQSESPLDSAAGAADSGNDQELQKPATGEPQSGNEECGA